MERIKHTSIWFHFIGLLFVSLASFISCKPPEIEFTSDQVSLRLSADTVFFDTILSTVTSVTKRLRVYNDETKAVNIANINISNASNAFSITVNGVEGTEFQQTELLAGDSLLILLKAKLENQNQDLSYVVEEQLTIVTNGTIQGIPVIAWGQDAHFLRDSVLVCNTTWTAGKPYVLYDNILIDSLCSLTINPGTRIYSHFGSAIFVQGSLKSKGSGIAPVLFTNDRFDAGFDTAPGQWEGIVFLEGSKENELSFTQIKNAHNAIWLGTPDTDTVPDLVINNTLIENMSGSGILSFTSDLSLTNCLINNCGEFGLACLAGGNYIITHNTFANFGYGFFRTQPIMVLTNNLQLGDGSILLEDIVANLKNNIIWGNQTDELILVNSGGKLFDVNLLSNLIKTTDIELEANNLINVDPLFIQPSEFNYRIDTLSPAINAAENLEISIDLDSLPRDSQPDIGAYEWRN